MAVVHPSMHVYMYVYIHIIYRETETERLTFRHTEIEVKKRALM